MGRNQDMPPVQGVADHEVLEGVRNRLEPGPGEEDAAVTSVADAPALGVRDEGEGEVGGFCAGTGGQRGKARRLCRVEYYFTVFTTVTILE